MKPWDHLKNNALPAMRTSGGTDVKVTEMHSYGVRLRIDAVDVCEMMPKSCREVGEWLIEVAKKAEVL